MLIQRIMNCLDFSISIYGHIFVAVSGSWRKHQMGHKLSVICISSWVVWCHKHTQKWGIWNGLFSSVKEWWMIFEYFKTICLFCWVCWYMRLESSRAVFWSHTSVTTFNFYCKIQPWSAWRGSSFLEAMLFCSLNDNTLEVFDALHYLIASD